MSILDHMTTAEYMSSQRGPMGSIGHFWAMVWRNSLLADGKYIKTSEQRRAGRRKSRIAPVEWFVRKPIPLCPPPHHGGSAADVEHHWPGCGHE